MRNKNTLADRARQERQLRRMIMDEQDNPDVNYFAARYCRCGHLDYDHFLGTGVCGPHDTDCDCHEFVERKKIAMLPINTAGTTATSSPFCRSDCHMRIWAGGPEAKPEVCACGAVRYVRHQCSCGNVHEQEIPNTKGSDMAEKPSSWGGL